MAWSSFEHNQAFAVMFLLFDMVSKHPVNIVTVARGYFHPGGAHFINSRIGLSFHALVPSKSTGVNSIGMGSPRRSLTYLIWSILLGLARSVREEGVQRERELWCHQMLVAS